MDVMILKADAWAAYSENAHLAVFDEKRPSEFNRIDFALLVVENENPLGFVTVRELDEKSIYWQFGGVFKTAKDTHKSFQVYKQGIDYCVNQGYENISTLVESENIVMLKFAFKLNFRIIGVRIFKNKVYCELLKGE